MPEELIHLLTESHTVAVGTTGPDGKPNVAGKSVMVKDPETIVWGELYFRQTYENLKKDPRASISVWTKNAPIKAYKINGRAALHENDEIASQLDERVRKTHRMELKSRREKMAAVIFTVEEVYDQTPDIERAGKQIS